MQPAYSIEIEKQMQEVSTVGCVAKFFEIRDNARFLAIEKPND
jgi:hypothetical protein